jgi:hypothetical protein
MLSIIGSYLWVLSVGILLIVLFQIFFWDRLKKTDRTTFESVNFGVYGISFQNVWMKKFFGGARRATVKINPKISGLHWLKLVVESQLNGTLISVLPKFNPATYSVESKKVIIWVSSEKEKNEWENWARQAEDKIFQNRKYEQTKPPLKPIVPMAS